MTQHPKTPTARAIGALFGTAALLAACGGGGGGVVSDTTPVDTTPKTVAQVVTVIDGAINGALVCIDKNANGACDDGETRGTTAADGSVTLQVPAADAGLYAVLALVGTDAVDAVNGPVTTAHALKAPADKPAFVSALTTLVAAQMDAGGTASAAAEKQLQDQLSLSGSLFDDFTNKTDAAGQATATLARLVVLTLQQQAVDTAGAKAADGSALSAADLASASSKSLLTVLPTLAAAAADPMVADAASASAREAAMRAAAATVAAGAGLTALNVASVVASGKLPGTPDSSSAAAAAASSLRWFSFGDAGNYAYRRFNSTAAQNGVVDGKRHFTEVREQKQTAAGGDVTQFLQWGDGLNNWQRNQIVWTGSEWFDCPNDAVHDATPWDAGGRSDSVYCKAFKTTNKRSERDIAGVRMADIVSEIRAYPLFDSAGKFAQWGPDPAAHAAALAAAFPAGSKLYYQSGADTANPDSISGLAVDVFVPYKAAVASGVAADCANVSGSNFAQFQTSAATLEQMVAAAPGKPCVYSVGANTGEALNQWWGNSTINVGDVADPYGNPTGFYRNGVKDLRASFSAGNVANFWLCLRRASDNSPRNCTAAGSGSYAIEALGDARVLRLAGLPLIAGNLTYNRIMVERAGKVWYGWRPKLQLTNQLRLNLQATDALFGALGVPAPAPAAPLTPDSLLAGYVSGAGTLGRNALALMQNDPAGLVGAWALGSPTDVSQPSFFFFANGQYVMVDPLGDTDSSGVSCGGAGVERGSYTFDRASGAFTVSAVTLDSNGCAGAHDPTSSANPNGNPRSIAIAADGQSMTVNDADGSFTFFRLTK